ncbi:MAG: hypothetical protein DMG80_01060 [Acidobacteria bacterium]|nr:MAG: hypothetical protein DMG80_01060 [Acidobacteriota bacterium]
MRPILISILFILCAVSSAPAQNGSCGNMSLAQGSGLNGFVSFPSDNAWNRNIATAPVDPNSDAIINFIGASTTLHPDFGAGEYQGSTIGIPYVVVGGQRFVKIGFNAYGDESDPGPMPVPKTAPIEGYPNPGSGDRHVLVLDRDNCWLYEMFGAHVLKNGNWTAASAAVWDLLNNEQRPYTWTSADAAGLPVFPGLARYDEVAAGAIQHALRFTLKLSRAAFTPPASHWAANSSNGLAAPMGMRLRLKASYDISGFPQQSKVILTALQRYGMIMADNGSSMFVSGMPDDRWNNDDLNALKRVPASAFEVVLMDPVYTQANVPQGPNPMIASFTANPQTVAKGMPVILSWSATNAGYFVVSPQVGAIRGTSVTLVPAKTTTYKLSVTNQYGRSTATVKVTVQ